MEGVPTAGLPTCAPHAFASRPQGWAGVPRTALGKGFSCKALTSPHFLPLCTCPRHEVPVGGLGQLLS